MWKLKTKGIPLNAVVFKNRCTALSSADSRIHSHQPWISAEHTEVSAVKEDSSRYVLALVTASQPHKRPFVSMHMTVNTDIVIRWAWMDPSDHLTVALALLWGSESPQLTGTLRKSPRDSPLLGQPAAFLPSHSLEGRAGILSIS